MLLSTIPKSPPKIIRENTYTDSENKGQFLLRILARVSVSETRPCETVEKSDNFKKAK